MFDIDECIAPSIWRSHLLLVSYEWILLETDILRWSFNNVE